MMNSKTKKTIINVLKNVLSWIISLIMLIPLFLIIINAFKSDAEAMTMTLKLPTEWVFTNFAVVIEKRKASDQFPEQHAVCVQCHIDHGFSGGYGGLCLLQKKQ